MPPDPTFSARALHEIVEEHAKRFPRKLVSLVASAQGKLTLTSVLETQGGDRVQLNHSLFRADVVELIAVLSAWVASPDSRMREHPDGTLPTPASSLGSERRARPRPASSHRGARIPPRP